MKSEHEQLSIMSLIQNFPENELTQKIIIPLFEHLGFHKVEFFGGTNEYGKDILCWDFDKLGDLKLIVAQVKHFKFTNRASNSSSLQTVVNQLVTCFKKQIPFSDNSFHLPSEAILISTYPIDAKSLLTRFGDNPDLVDRKLKIIDGLKLAFLISEKTPHLIRDLMGIEAHISQALKSSLNNEILLKALGYQNKKNLKNIYTDLDFSLGRNTTELFFTANLKPLKTTLRLNLNEWNIFKDICQKSESQFSLDFILKDLSTIEIEYQKSLIKYNKWLAKHQLEKSKLEDLLAQFLQLTGFQFQDSNENILIGDIDSAVIKNKQLEINNQKRKLENLAINDPLTYKVEVDGNILAKQILRKRMWIEGEVKKINTIKPNSSEIKEFIYKCKAIIDTAGFLLSSDFMKSIIGFDETLEIRRDFESARFKLPIETIFDTGVSVAVLGEAGAGKSTSLQMYAIKKEGVSDKLYICVPLSNVTQNWQKLEPNLKDDCRITRFDEGIANYLIHKNVPITGNQFSYILNTRPTVLMLDGIDEAIKLNSWLPKGIEFLAKKYCDKLQLIVTSRMSGSYLNDFSLFTVTLLPFTNEQRNNFIDNWFGNDDISSADKIKSHLQKNRAISELVKNPLLTTTLCVLAKNDVPLPNTEIKLYDHRILLLTSYYDIVKGLDPRVSSSPQVLTDIAQKLAFNLHSVGKREEDKLILFEKLLTSNDINKEELGIAISELIDPCNILVPMTDDGKFGFGHLRYQEHLAAKEILASRIDILPLLNNPWWRGVLVLFAQMNSSLIWLFNDLSIRGSFLDINSTLKEMIKARPKKEQEYLNERLNSWINTEINLNSSNLDFEIDPH